MITIMNFLNFIAIALLGLGVINCALESQNLSCLTLYFRLNYCLSLMKLIVFKYSTNSIPMKEGGIGPHKINIQLAQTPPLL